MLLTPDGSTQGKQAGKEHDYTIRDGQFLTALNQAIQNGELRLHYQPRFSSETRATTMLEALVRWQRPEVGLLFPEVFLPPAEQHGLIFSLDLWVFEQCCIDLLWLRKHINSSLKIAINVSVLECESVYHAQKLIGICDKYGLSLSDFELEITERTHIRDFRKVKSFCETLYNLGASFSLDDFGTGQSPLSNLCLLPIDIIKIDRSFIKDLGENKREQILVRNLINMAHDMEIEIVAEGVEFEHQRDMLTDMGCDQLQGYLLSKPVARDELNPDLLHLF